MMLNSSLKKLASACRRFAKRHALFDIVLYGSSVRGKQEAGDTDLLLIFRTEPLKLRAEMAQDLKGILDREVTGQEKGRLDVKTMNLDDLFDGSFLARQGVLVEGYSLLHGAPLAERLGFSGYTLFTYNLKNLTHTQKTRFTYALIGRNREGMREKLSAQALGKGALIVPMRNSYAFEAFLQRWDVAYKTKRILVSLL